MLRISVSLACLFLLSACQREEAGTGSESDGSTAPESAQVAAEQTYWPVVDDVFSGTERWRVLAQDPDSPIQRRPLRSPTSAPGRSVGLLGWVMPPPAAVGILAPSVEGPLRLQVSAGLNGKPPPVKRAHVRFSISIEGQEVWSHERLVGTHVDREVNRWVAVLDENGDPFQVEPGDAVHFETELLELPQIPFPAELDPPQIGFGEPRFEAERPVRSFSGEDERPNLVLMLVDTLRRDKLSPYASPQATSAQTPAIQSLADRGLLFENAYSAASWTWPSTASILTGLLPAEHGLEGAFSPYLDGRLETLAEEVRSNGYRTGAFVGNPLIDRRSNFQQGFDHYIEADGQFRKSHEFVPGALDWIEENQSEKFFLYLHTADTHYPYQPLEGLLPEDPDELDKRMPRNLKDLHREFKQRVKRSLEAGEEIPVAEVLDPAIFARLETRYLACVQTADHWTGQVVDRLELAGVLDETVFAFTTDHGEEFLEHGLISHGGSVYDALVHIPLILAGPGVPPGERSTKLVSNRHLADTFARLSGGQLAQQSSPADLLQPSAQIPGQTFASAIAGSWDGAGADLVGVFDGRYALHTVRKRELRKEFSRLYDLASPEGEFRDVAAEHPGQVAQMMAALQEHLEEAEALPYGFSQSVDPDTVEFLEQLGYTATKSSVDKD